MPHFQQEPDPTMVNGWNAQLEAWLVEIQDDTTAYYLMLTETARVVKIWKWIVIAIFALLSCAGFIATFVTLTDSTRTWLTIFNGCVAMATAVVVILDSALGFNEWCHDCRDTAGHFITLGRRIESQKRIPRSQRLDNGIKFSNAASMRFEELRADAPYIFSYLRKRHALKITSQAQVTNIPDVLLSYHVNEPVPLGKDADHVFETVEDSACRPRLQQLIQDRLHAQEEQDALARYEDFVREQYAVASDSVLRKTLK